LHRVRIACYIRAMMKMISLWMDEKQLRALKALGKEKGGITVSALIRIAVAAYLKREGK